MKTLIKTQNLHLIRDSQVILKDICLVIKENSFTTIVGPNGAGKSTLLECLLGLHKPSQGAVFKKPNLNIGYVPQRILIDGALPMSVDYFLRLGRKKTAALKSYVDNFKLEPILDKPLKVLSGGELKRVLLARALWSEPELLILDEPTASLDMPAQVDFYRLLADVKHRLGLSILLVSHDLHFVFSATQQVICMYKHICCSGQPQEVARNPEFNKLFGEQVLTSMAIYDHSHDHSHG